MVAFAEGHPLAGNLGDRRQAQRGRQLANDHGFIVGVRDDQLVIGFLPQAVDQVGISEFHGTVAA